MPVLSAETCYILLVCFLSSGCCCCCWALKSTHCTDIALAPKPDELCPSAVCGAVSLPDAHALTFLERLSPQCRNLMHRYRTSDRAPNNGKLAYGFNSTIRNAEQRQQACPSSRFAMMATNPVVVEASEETGVKSFVLCTVPNSGCTDLRKLIHTVIRYPESLPEDPVAQFKQAHFSSYSTLWHYGLWEVPADVYPSFIVGRNPYVRLLQSFLNRKARIEYQIDREGIQQADELFEDPFSSGWSPDVADTFHRFVRRLHAHGVEHVSRHFRLQLNACANGLAAYEYHLPIEDLRLWFPCWEEGLNLQQFTSQGYSSEAGCWWKPEDMDTCTQFYESTHPNWTVGDWKSLNRWPGSAVPLQGSSLGLSVSSSEGGATEGGVTGSRRRQAAMSQDNSRPIVDVSHMWRTLYTQEVGDLVYAMYRVDFDAFGYARETF